MSLPPHQLTRLLAAAAVVVALTGCGAGSERSDWPLPNLDLHSTRALTASGIDRANVHTLRVAWRFRLRAAPGYAGAITATPVVSGGVVFVQDMRSNVFALDLKTGALRWRRLFDATNPGPDGVAVSGGRVFGATDSSVFALDSSTGRPLWHRFLASQTARYVDMAPQVADGLVFVSTLGYPPNGRGVLYALDEHTGRVRWRLETIRGKWSLPAQAGGGGAWQAPSVDGSDVYWGIANPLPYGGSPAHPNGGAYAGRALYTDSLLDVDAATGRLRWYDQVTPHDVRDYDFQLPPIIATIGGTNVVLGAGKAGIVIAWNRSTHRRLWQVEVGLHRNSRGPLPPRRVSVCPGLYGGVLTPMALSDDRLFVPVVDLCMQGSASGYENLANVDVSRRGTGEFIALDASTGARIWSRRLPQPAFGCATVGNGVVFTATLNGTVYAFNTQTGAVLWKQTMRAGINSCPALASNMLFVGSGVPVSHGSVLELTALTTG